jgi:hypothetical protein
MQEQWKETMAGGSPEAERAEFEALARDIMLVQLKNKKTASAHGVPHAVDRAFHAKATLATDRAELTFLKLPGDLRQGFAQPGQTYPVVVRFSNAAGTGQSDAAPDLRGVALRVRVSPEESHDLLMTNFPVSHARDAREFVEFAKATAGGPLARTLGVLRLIRLFGLPETVRMLRNVLTARRQTVGSVATTTYWSRGAVRWGPTLAVRYLLRPEPGAGPAPQPPADDPDYLSTDASRRLASGDVRFELCVQRYVDEKSTPIENTAVEWTEQVSPAEPVAVLTIRRGDLSTADALARAQIIEKTAFNPWNTTDEFRPLGNLNRARKEVYDASSAQRLGYRFESETPVRNVLVGAAVRAVFRVVNQYRLWYRLPVRLGLLNIEALRYVLRARNLLDSEVREAPPQARPVPPAPPGEDVMVERTFDGTSNDLSAPAMGSVGSAFGRNMPPQLRPELYDEPSPILVSQQLLHRDTFLPARSLNLLAAAWIQFQVHDWVDHARYPLGQATDVRVPLLPGMTWSNVPGGPPEQEMRIAGNIPFEGPGHNPMSPVFPNATTPWWDGSEVYGSAVDQSNKLRDGAKLRLTPQGYLPDDASGQTITGFNESWWLGLGSMHTLFAREHNVLCDELRSRYPSWGDERVFQTARLIVSALIAKIHTVEWTPAILGTEVIEIGLNTNWSGPPAHDWLTRLGIWLTDSHASVGIPKTMPDHGGVPYSLTEEFATVYRMHPLLPDDYRFVDHRTGALLGDRGFFDIQGTKADAELRNFGLENTLYSFGLSYPGAITLHNNPRSLEKFERNGELIDLSVVDLVRTRRRGVPRYNDFRAGLHKPRIKHWEELCQNQESVRRMKEIYRSVNEVDTMVGLFAETPPEGFGFSDTAFRIFILMASRRLQSDRFLTVDFRPEIYSPFGMDWIANNGMTSIILRHCPDLAGIVPRTTSAFAPWRPVIAPTAGPDDAGRAIAGRTRK